MIFKSKKYPLPKFPDDVAPKFHGFCEELPDERVAEFIPEVREVVKHFGGLAQKFPMLDMHRVQQLGQVCIELLRIYPEHEAADKKLIVGAVRYFASTDDAISETAFASGLDDDARVMNHVLEQVGREDLIIDL